MSLALHHRGRVAALSRSRASDDPELVDARRELAAETIASHVARVVAQAPPLTPEQRDRIAALLRPDRIPAPAAQSAAPSSTRRNGFAGSEIGGEAA